MTNARTYTARSIKATGLLEETRMLLRAWRPGETAAEFRRRVVDEGLLGKATASRTIDVVAHAFNQRFLGAGNDRAQSIRGLLLRVGAGRWFEQLCFLLAARNDAVLRDAAAVFLAEARAAGQGSVDTRSFEAFLLERQAEGRTVQPWSPSVRRSVAQHILGQLTDFQALGRPGRMGTRALTPVQADPVAVAWLAYDLHFSGVTDPSILEHEDWAIWAMRSPEVRDRLLQADAALWDLQAAGSVAQFAWHCARWEEVVDVLARCSVR